MHIYVFNWSLSRLALHGPCLSGNAGNNCDPQNIPGPGSRQLKPPYLCYKPQLFYR